MRSIHLIGGEKGGVGKSVFARVLCQWLIDHSIKFSAFDADLSQGALLRSYAEQCRAVDLSVFESADQIMDSALRAQGEVVVDLPARSLSQLGRWLQSGDVVALAAEHDVRLVYWHVSDGGFDSVNSLSSAMQLLGEPTQFVVVCNYGRSPDFSQLEASEPVRTLLERSGNVIELPRLDPQIVHKTEGLATSLAVAFRESQGALSLSQMQKRRASEWLARAYLQLESLLGEWSRPEGAVTQVTQLKVTEAAGPKDAETSKSRNNQPTVGTIIRDGATTWTEVGEGHRIHHVRYR